MAYDKTEPPTKLISGLAVASIVILVIARNGLTSYWNIMHDDEMNLKVNQRPAAQLIRLREEASQRLSGGAMPIDQAMSTIANGQRPAAISPRPSTDMAPLNGWTQSARTLPTEMPMSPPVAPTPLPTPEASADGGVPVTAVSLEGLGLTGLQNPHPVADTAAHGATPTVVLPPVAPHVGTAAGAPLTPQTAPTAPVHPAH